jgi:transposase
MMSLPPKESQITAFDVPYLAEGLFKKTDRYRLFREKILPALRRAREKLALLYCAENGRPAIEPVIMAGVTLLQFMEKAPDRKAIENIRLHIGWKYALDLSWDYTGFHPTSLSEFRKRLVKHSAARVLFDAVLDEVQAAGLVKKRRKDRIDSTHVLGNVARMSRLEVIWETIRLFLEELQKREVVLLPDNEEELEERYVDGTLNYQQMGKATLERKTKRAGLDMWGLVQWLSAQPEWIQRLERSELLVRVFHEQFEVCEQDGGESPAFRDKEGSGTVKNPHDPDVQWSSKDKQLINPWEGYKTQVVESIPEERKDAGGPKTGFITEITTTEALVSDTDGMAQAEASQKASGIGVSEEVYADAAYITDDTLAAARASGRELIGPARPAPTKGVLPVEAFDVDMEKGRAVCPGGKTSTRYRVTTERRSGRELHQFEWGEQCDVCSLQRACTKSKKGRRKLTVGRHHAELQARRREMETEAFKEKLRLRVAIESTISELVRGYGLRRTRYRGLAKVRLGNYLIGAACNVNRLLRRVAWDLETSTQTT